METPPDRSPVGRVTAPRFRLLPLLCVGLAAAAVALAPLPLEPAAHRTLVIVVSVGGLWLTEALPAPVTALLVPLMGVLFGITGARGAFSAFGDPVLFLFLGAFLLADAAATHGLTARLARAVLASRWISAQPGRLLWAMAIIGCTLGAWMSNTATTVLLLPLALSAERLGSPRLLMAVVLMASWGPSLGGLATPVGTAPNLIGLRLIEEATGARPTFAQWMILFAPLALISTAISAWWLRHQLGGEARAAPGPSPPASPSVPWSRAERLLMPLFGAVILLWVLPGLLEATPLGRSPLLGLWTQRVPEAVVPLAGALLLFALPAARGGSARILDASAFRRIDWGTLILFGGGLSLGGMMFESGLAQVLGEWLFLALPVPGLFGVVLAATLMGVVFSELTSNTASAAVVVPVVFVLAQSAGVDPIKPALAATAACSFGFMLPISTPPNAMVYATGKVSMRQMIANGFLLDAVGILLVSVWVTLLG